MLSTSLLVALVLPNAEPSFQQQAAPSHAAERETRFALLPHIFIDLHRGLETNRGSDRAGVIKDCGSETWNCLTGTTFNIMWRKECGPYEKGQSWSVDTRDGEPVKFEVLHELSSGYVHSPRSRWLVSSTYDPDVVYIFTDGIGLTGLVQDPLRRSDLASRLESAEKREEVRTSGGRTEDGLYVSNLVGWGKIGECV